MSSLEQDIKEYKDAKDKEEKKLKSVKKDIKELKKTLNRNRYGNVSYLEIMEAINLKESEKQEITSYLVQMKELNEMNLESLKVNQSLVKTHAEGRNYTDDMCLQSTKDILTSNRVNRQAFLSRCFIGPHGRKLMNNNNDIINDISGKLKEHCHRTVNHDDIDEYCGKVKDILISLDSICSITKSASEKIVGDRLTILQKQIDCLSQKWREMELSVTLKMHVLESHVLDFAKDLNILGLLGEEPIERTHKDDNTESQRCNTNDFKASQIQLDKRRVLKQSPGVQKISNTVQQSRKRKFSAQSIEKQQQKLQQKKEMKMESLKKNIDFSNEE